MSIGRYGSTFIVLNAIVGTGMLGIPYGLKDSGMVAGVIIICAMSFVANYCCSCMLGTAAKLGQTSYESAVMQLFGPVGARAMKCCMIFKCLVACTAFMVVYADAMLVLYPYFGQGWSMEGFQAMQVALAGVFVLLPLALARDVQFLNAASAFAVALYVSFVMLLLYSGMTAAVAAMPKVLAMPAIKMQGLLPMLSICVFASGSMHAVFQLPGSRDEVKRSVRDAYIASNIMYVTVGVLCFSVFQMTTQDNVLLNILEGTVLGLPPFVRDAVQIGFGGTVLLSYPISLCALRQSLYSLINAETYVAAARNRAAADVEMEIAGGLEKQRDGMQEVPRSSAAATKPQAEVYMPFGHFAGIGVGTLLVSIILALGVDLHTVLVLGGATATTLIDFVLPLVCVLKLDMVNTSIDETRPMGDLIQAHGGWGAFVWKPQVWLIAVFVVNSIFTVFAEFAGEV